MWTKWLFPLPLCWCCRGRTKVWMNPHSFPRGMLKGQHCLLRCFPSSSRSSVLQIKDQEAPSLSFDLTLALCNWFSLWCLLIIIPPPTPSRPHSISCLCVCVWYLGTAAYIIDTVGLTVEPRTTVQSGTAVRLRCQVSVSHSNIPHLTHTFQLTRDDVPIYSNNTTKDTVVYEINPARAADSGNYECRVSVKDKSRTSNSQKLDVTGRVYDQATVPLFVLLVFNMCNIVAFVFLLFKTKTYLGYSSIGD